MYYNESLFFVLVSHVILQNPITKMTITIEEAVENIKAHQQRQLANESK